MVKELLHLHQALEASFRSNDILYWVRLFTKLPLRERPPEKPQQQQTCSTLVWKPIEGDDDYYG